MTNFIMAKWKIFLDNYSERCIIELYSTQKEVFNVSKRLQMTMSDELMGLVDKFAKFNGISRAAAVSVLCSQALSQSNAMQAMSDMMKVYQEEAKKNSVGLSVELGK
jgi:hypothetical protein